MRRKALEHLIRAAAAITDQYETWWSAASRFLVPFLKERIVLLPMPFDAKARLDLWVKAKASQPGSV